MKSAVHIVIQGLPERVQEIADVLDMALPNVFEWYDFAAISGELDIILKGARLHELAVRPVRLPELAS